MSRSREEYEKVLRLRSLGYRYVDISSMTGVPETTIGKWCTGVHKPHAVWTKEEKARWNEKRFTRESRAKMSVAGRRRAPPSPEVRDNIRRSKLGSKNPMWKGDEVTEGTVRWRLRRDVSVPKGHDRHHIDGNGKNSDSSNILVLTRREHMIEDGRMFRRDEFGRFISAERGGV